MSILKLGGKLGQYRIRRKLETGGFAGVYEAYDTIEGIHVALKIPHAEHISQESLQLFRNEVRLTARLDHPNILPIKHAGFLDERFVIVYPLGKGSLEQRLTKRMSTRTALDFAEQAISAVAAAHRGKILHMDLKPENYILFDGNRLRLADFGLARIARCTLSGSGSGTVGYIAPEQAMGRPSFRSDVFSLGLILYRMFSGELPAWPFEWPLPGRDKLRRTLPPAMVELLKRALNVDQKKRFKDAVQMLAAFQRAKPKAARRAAALRRKRRRRAPKRDQVKAYGFKVFLQRYKKELATRLKCGKCRGPVSEIMLACPWCGAARRKLKEETGFPSACRRCGRGRKLDWRFCAWCHGPAFKTVSERHYSDKRYAARCPACRETALMPFARYCPFCRAKSKRKWEIKRAEHRCPRCRWDVLPEFWSTCPWCSKAI